MFSALLLYLLLPQAHAELKPYEIDWQCNQSADSPLPSQTKIKILVDLDTGNVDVAEFARFLDRAAQEDPGRDYFECAESFKNKVRPLLRKLHFETQPDAVRDTCRNLDTVLGGLISNYGIRSYKRGAVLPAEPGSPIQPSFSEKDLVQIHQHINSELCQNLVDERGLDETFIKTQLPKILSQRKPSDGCFKKLSSSYMRLLQNAQLTNEQCKTAKKTCERRRTAVFKTMGLLAQIDSRLVPPWYNTSSSCEQPPDWKVFNEQLLNYINSSPLNDDCSKLPVGETLQVDRHPLTSLNSHYKLTRKADQPDAQNPTKKNEIYEAILQLNFFKEEGVQLEPSVHAQYVSWTKECLKNAPPLRGPHGEILQITIQASETSSDTKSENRIKIASEGRPNSGMWTEQMLKKQECSTAIHELFHLLGLVDEYRESMRGMIADQNGNLRWVETGAKWKSHDCRVLGPQDSIMNSNKLAYQSASPSRILKACSCPPHVSANQCRKRMKDLNKCPSKRQKLIEDNDTVSSPQGTVLLQNKRKYYVMSTETRPPKRNSLLFPAQFRAIVQPNCFSNNSTYAVCSKEAQKSSRVSRQPDRCGLALPAACKQGGEAWLK